MSRSNRCAHFCTHLTLPRSLPLPSQLRTRSSTSCLRLWCHKTRLLLFRPLSGMGARPENSLPKQTLGITSSNGASTRRAPLLHHSILLRHPILWFKRPYHPAKMILIFRQFSAKYVSLAPRCVFHSVSLVPSAFL